MEARAETFIKGQTRAARKIPYWLWIVIAKILGIKLKPDDKPIISAILHIATFGSAAALFCTNLTYSISAVISNNTKNDIMDGIVSIMLISYYCGLGVYSHRLAYRLFVHPKFLDMLRLHSKTIFKLPAAFLLFLMLSAFVVVLNVATVSYIYDSKGNATVVLNDTTEGVNPCEVAGMSVGICQTYWASQVIFSLFFLVWNTLVAVVLVSVARTQTIQIRKFLQELEHDALLLDQKLTASYGSQGLKANKDDLKNFVWMDDDHIGEVFLEARMTEGVGARDQVLDNRVEETREIELSQSGERPEQAAGGASGFQPLETVMDETEAAIVPHIMSEQEIMHKYWKISMNVRLASVALQRWMSSIIGLITTWSAIRLVYWLDHSPTASGLLEFIIPLVLLPLLASSYAEVNYEGAKIIQSILPTESRVFTFQYLYGHQVQMTVYGHAISYGTIGTVVAGILAAFASKILLQEISGI